MFITTIGFVLVLASAVALAANINGTDGPDTIVGTDGGDVIDGLGGNDNISGMGGADIIDGGLGEDELRGADDFTTVTADGGNVVRGGDGDDALWGGSREDDLYGGAGADVITEGPEGDAALDNAYGEDGDDEIDVTSVPARKDVVDCGPGTDHVEADSLDEVLANCESVERLTTEEFQSALTPGRCVRYRLYDPTNFGPMPLRWGDSTFGYRHIRNKHGFKSRRINYVLNNGQVIEVQGTKQVVQGRYPGDARKYRVVFNDTYKSAKCPSMKLGIITAYYGG